MLPVRLLPLNNACSTNSWVSQLSADNISFTAVPCPGTDATKHLIHADFNGSLVWTGPTNEPHLPVFAIGGSSICKLSTLLMNVWTHHCYGDNRGPLLYIIIWHRVHSYFRDRSINDIQLKQHIDLYMVERSYVSSGPDRLLKMCQLFHKRWNLLVTLYTWGLIYKSHPGKLMLVLVYLGLSNSCWF